MSDYQIANLRAELLKKIENSGGADISALAAQVAQLALDVLGLSSDVTTLQGSVATKADQADIAPGFSGATNYSAGDIVFYNGDLYRFTADHSAGAWIGSDVSLIDVSIAIDDLKPINAITSGSPKAVTSGAVYTALHNLGSGVFISKLWENADTTSNFAAQHITLNSNTYDLLLTNTHYSTTDTKNACTIIAPKGENFYLAVADTTASSGIRVAERAVNYVSDTELSITDATEVTGTAASVVKNSRVIPTVVYGITFS